MKIIKHRRRASALRRRPTPRAIHFPLPSGGWGVVMRFDCVAALTVTFQ